MPDILLSDALDDLSNALKALRALVPEDQKYPVFTGADTAALADLVTGGGADSGYFGMAAKPVGHLLINALAIATLGTQALSANQLTLYPLLVPARRIWISALGVYVTTGVASAEVRIGIYADNDGVPDGGDLLASTGALAAATSSTWVEEAITPLELEPGGGYWLAIVSGHGPTLRSIPVTATQPLPIATDLSGTGVPGRRTASFSFAALPATCPSGTAIGSANQVAIGMKIGTAP